MPHTWPQPIGVIWNPTAGRRHRQYLLRVLEHLFRDGVVCDIQATEHAGHAAVLARDMASNGIALVLAAGGDGTVASAAAGLAGGSACLGVIPMGTTNVLARELRLPSAPASIASAVRGGATLPLWPGILHGGGSPRLFLQMAGIGLDAAVVHNTPMRLKRAIGRGAYVWQAAIEMARSPRPTLRLRLDGNAVDAQAAIVSKGRLYAGGHLLAPAAQPTEPGFQVALFHWPGRLARATAAAALPLGLLARAPGVRIVPATRIEVLGPPGVPVQTDGDAAGFTPATIRDAPAPLRILVHPAQVEPTEATVGKP